MLENNDSLNQSLTIGRCCTPTDDHESPADRAVPTAAERGELLVLHLEDDPVDAELIHAALANDGWSYRFIMASNRREFEQALGQEQFDLILSDYSLPDFDAVTALCLAQEQQPDTPIILVSGTVGEEQAIESLKSGATDYVLKSRLLRLAPAVHRAMRDVAARQARRQTEAVLRAQEESLRALTINSPDAIARWDRKLRLRYCNPAFERLTGRTAAELLGKTWAEAGLPLIPEWEAGVQRSFHTEAEVSIDFSLSVANETRFFETRLVPECGDSGRTQFILAVTREVTRLRAAVEELRRETALLEALVDSSLDGILVVNRAGQKVAQNGKFNSLLQIPPPIALPGMDRERLEHIVSLTKFPQQFRERVAHLYAHPEETSRDEIEFKDGRVLDRNSAPVRGKDGTYHGRIWMFRDITERKLTEAKLESLNKELMASSHQAGMAEVATNVLHNVGNVLNSVNVSATLIADRIKKSRVASLTRVAGLLEEHRDAVGAFFTQDEQGKQLPGFIVQLATHLVNERADLITELQQLKKNVEHIKDIVAMQQSFAKMSGTAEPLDLTELVEDALRINASSLNRHDIAIVRDFGTVPVVSAQKHKVLQILVNLIRNAKHACDASGREDKQMTLRIGSDARWVRVSVSDNGVGITSENMPRIFSHGFTTKKEGHGFGLHSGAMTAQEMGGQLRVQSDGANQGATFTLELPLPPNGRTE